MQGQDLTLEFSLLSCHYFIKTSGIPCMILRSKPLAYNNKVLMSLKMTDSFVFFRSQVLTDLDPSSRRPLLI